MSLGAVVLAVSGCAPAQDADGLLLVRTDAGFREPAVAARDAGEPGPDCRQLAAFEASARPVLLTDCVRCHNGSKMRATRELDLTALEGADPNGRRLACSNVLLTVDPVELGSSIILTSVDPSDPTTEHEFKYRTSAEFATYRTTIMKWLETE